MDIPSVYPSELVQSLYDWSVPLTSPHRFDPPTLVMQSDPLK